MPSSTAWEIAACISKLGLAAVGAIVQSLWVLVVLA